jgi:hypothetical protein
LLVRVCGLSAVADRAAPRTAFATVSLAGH